MPDDMLYRVVERGAETTDAAAAPDVGRSGRPPRVGSPPVVTGPVAVEEPVGWVDEAPPATLPLIEPPVARVVEQLEQAPGVGGHTRVGDNQDHLLVALVLGQERAEVVVVQRPDARADHAVRPIGGQLPFVPL